MSVFSGNITIESDARFRDCIVASNRDFAFERPSFSIKGAAEDLEQVHGRVGFSDSGIRLLVNLGYSLSRG